LFFFILFSHHAKTLKKNYKRLFYLSLAILLILQVGTAMGVAPVAREDHGAVVRGNELLIAAGCNFGKRNCFADLHILDLDTMAWRVEIVESVGPKLTPREAVTMNVVQGDIFLFGGCYLSQQCFSDLIVLKPSDGALKCGGQSHKGACSGHGECRVYLQKEDQGNKQKSTTTLIETLSASSSSSKKGFIKTLLKGEVGHTPVANKTNNTVVSNVTAVPSIAATDNTTANKKYAPLLDSAGFSQTYMCQCSTGWQGEQCEVRALCPSGCSGHGTCVAGGYCMCSFEWVGKACERERQLPRGQCPNSCSGHGTCQIPTAEKSVQKSESLPNASITMKTNSSETNVTLEVTNASIAEPRFLERFASFNKVGGKGGNRGSTFLRVQQGIQQLQQQTVATPPKELRVLSLLDLSDHLQANVRKSPVALVAHTTSDQTDLTNDPECMCVDGWSGMACDQSKLVVDAKDDKNTDSKLNASSKVDTSPTAPSKTTEGLNSTSFKRVKSHTKARNDAVDTHTYTPKHMAAAGGTVAAGDATSRTAHSNTKTTTSISLTVESAPQRETTRSCSGTHNCNGHGICKSGQCYCYANFAGVGCRFSQDEKSTARTASTTASVYGREVTRRLKSFLSFDSSWHWVTVSLLAGSLVGFFAPWKKCSSSRKKRSKAWR